eukprot:71928_1
MTSKKRSIRALDEDDNDDNHPPTKRQKKSGISKVNNEIISLQVGERKFITKINTLTQNDDNNYFAKLFSGHFAQNATYNQSYFIDRNGDVFSHILDYLRCHKFIIPDNDVLKQKILNEAQFYMIKMPQPDPKFLDSKILSISEEQKIRELFDDLSIEMKEYKGYPSIPTTYIPKDDKCVVDGEHLTVILVEDTAGNKFGIKSDVGIGTFTDYYTDGYTTKPNDALHKEHKFVYFNIYDVANKIAPFSIMGIGNELKTGFRTYTGDMSLGCAHMSRRIYSFLSIPSNTKGISTRIDEVQKQRLWGQIDYVISSTAFIIKTLEIFIEIDEDEACAHKW